MADDEREIGEAGAALASATDSELTPPPYNSSKGMSRQMQYQYRQKARGVCCRCHSQLDREGWLCLACLIKGRHPRVLRPPDVTRKLNIAKTRARVLKLRSTPEGRTVDNEYHRLYQRSYRPARRLKALSLIANGASVRCANCGCDEYSALEINHVGGGGRREYKAHGYGAKALYERIASGQRGVDGLSILCKVCNILEFVERKFPQLRGRITVMWK